MSRRPSSSTPCEPPGRSASTMQPPKRCTTQRRYRRHRSEDAAEDRIQRLPDVRALGGGSGILLGRRVTRGSHESAGVGVERVGDVNEDLAG